ncbi:hypothetical protein HNR56_001903 [Roseospira marina]|nr:hypothetical protein [Roseospira marina]MBB5087207.1 hypothetical protein [Roseospira marina]
MKNGGVWRSAGPATGCRRLAAGTGIRWRRTVIRLAGRVQTGEAPSSASKRA